MLLERKIMTIVFITFTQVTINLYQISIGILIRMAGGVHTNYTDSTIKIGERLEEEDWFP